MKQSFETVTSQLGMGITKTSVSDNMSQEIQENAKVTGAEMEPHQRLPYAFLSHKRWRAVLNEKFVNICKFKSIA